MFRDDLYGFHAVPIASVLEQQLCQGTENAREGFSRVLGERRDQDMIHNLDFGFVRSSDFYENISRIQGDL